LHGRTEDFSVTIAKKLEEERKSRGRKRKKRSSRIW
jgi:hypothetical protein